MSALTLNVPLELPSAERLEELVREAARDVAREQGQWLDFEEAAAYLKISIRTFRRYREAGGLLSGLPACEVSSTTRLFWRGDLDAIIAARLVSHGPKVIDFPSLELQKAAL